MRNYLELSGTVRFPDLDPSKEDEIMDQILEIIENYGGEAALTYRYCTEEELLNDM